MLATSQTKSTKILLTYNTHIESIEPLVTPEALHLALPITEDIAEHVTQGRQQITDIIHGADQRLLVIVGPCSIHDPQSALEYAQRLKKLQSKVADNLLLVMRVYFEKPRTTIGWKGFINDPYLDNSYAINDGLHAARKLLLELNQMGIYTATEFVDTITPQYIADLISWAAIGARTVESQAHRMLASGLSMPVGFKNNTSGDIKSAVNGVLAAKHQHRFLGIDANGEAAMITTKGNHNGHIVLRGGSSGPNYDSNTIQHSTALLTKLNLPNKVMIDCSHDNCAKDYTQKNHVINSICQQLGTETQPILGLMLESHLVPGRQNLISDEPLVYGQSITDACVGWQETETLLTKVAEYHNISEMVE